MVLEELRPSSTGKVPGWDMELGEATDVLVDPDDFIILDTALAYRLVLCPAEAERFIGKMRRALDDLYNTP